MTIVRPVDPRAVASALADASRDGVSTLIQGRGARMGWGDPVEATLTVDMTALDQLVDYSPADMVVTAQSGMTLAQLNGLLAPHNQVLPLEVPWPDRTTLGGLVAAAALSLSRAGYGEVRDWLLGLEVATSEGRLVHGGSRVVKNVAGYDLCKLYAGSLGTLGAITELTFKVRPRWESTRLVSASFTGTEAQDAALAAIQTTGLMPAIAAGQFSGTELRLFLGFDGPEETVSWQQAEALSLYEHLGGHDLRALQGAEALQERKLLADDQGAHPGHGLHARLSVLPSDLLGTWQGALAAISEQGGDVQGMTQVQHGTLWLHMSRASRWPELIARLRALVAPAGGHVVLEARPPEAGPVKSQVLDSASRMLMRRLKDGLDPAGILAPGRFDLEEGVHGRA